MFAEDLENVISEIGSGDQTEETIDTNNEEEVEQIEDAREEEEALDVDGEYDYISNYERLYENGNNSFYYDERY
jgi:flagellar hook-associated protein FlgK